VLTGGWTRTRDLRHGGLAFPAALIRCPRINRSYEAPFATSFANKLGYEIAVGGRPWTREARALWCRSAARVLLLARCLNGELAAECWGRCWGLLREGAEMA
jgi:hypothetical protein